MNVRLVPKFYVAGEGRAWFVEGFTSEDTRHWDFITAFRSASGVIDMSTARRVADLGDNEWTLTPWGSRPPDEMVLTFMYLVGNMQRGLATLAPAKVPANG